MGLLAIIGLCVLGGGLGAWVFQKLHIPQVVGCIVIGVLIGESGLRVVQSADILALHPFNLFALGLIGFLVVQLIGPSCTKLAVRMANEIDRNITEEDVMAEMCVGDAMKLTQNEAIPVLAGDGSEKTEGILDLHYARRRIREELIRRTSAA
jgi:hypothetical protein